MERVMAMGVQFYDGSVSAQYNVSKDKGFEWIVLTFRDAGGHRIGEVSFWPSDTSHAKLLADAINDAVTVPDLGPRLAVSNDRRTISDDDFHGAA
jgi:hypothetical protein